MKYKRLRAALWTLGLLLFLALARDFLANGRPLYCRIDGETFFPGLRTVWADEKKPYGNPVLDSLYTYNLWKKFPYESSVFAPVPFSPGDFSDRPSCISQPPGTVQPEHDKRFRHWLGTDDSGRDVAAGIISGARIAILTGLLAMFVALSIGLVLGSIAGFFGDDRLRVRRGRLMMNFIGIFFGIFYAFVVREYAMKGSESAGEGMKSIGIFIGILLFFNLLGWLANRIPFFSKTMLIPADLLIMRLAEVFNSIPKLIFIIAIAAMMPQNRSLWVMIGLIGALSWTGVAQFIRAELLRIRTLEYVTAARSLGYSDARTLLRHALPNALRPVMVAFALGIAGAILLEAALSFLGISDETLKGMSWGSLLNSARSNLRFWWIAVPPGLAICITVMALNAVGDALSERIK